MSRHVLLHVFFPNPEILRNLCLLFSVQLLTRDVEHMTFFFIRFQLVSVLLVHYSHVISFLVQAKLSSQVNALVLNKANVSID